MWHAFHPSSGIVHSLVSTLRKQSPRPVMSTVKRLPRSIVTGCPSAPKCRWTTCLRTRRTPLSRSFQVFGHKFRHGHYSSRISSVRADTVASVCRDIAKTQLLESRQYPQKPLGAHSRELNKRLSRMLCHYGF